MTDTASDIQPVSNRPWRILVVENDPVMLADHIRNLHQWGFEVYPAQGKGEFLLQDARRIAREHRCHLALVDMRLLDDNDLSDLSGFDLIRELSPLPAFVVSSYGSLQRASQAIGKSGAKEFIGKEEGPRRLRSAIERFFEDYCGIAQFCGEIKWATAWRPEKIIGELFEKDVLVEPREVDCVVRRLFHETPFDQAHTLRFSTISSAARSLQTHSLRHSAVFRVNADTFQPVFVKFAAVHQLEAEQRNYTRHIWQQLPAARHSQLQQYESVGFVGGIRYGFLGTDTDGLKTLADRLEEMTDQEINRCLRTFFQDIWGAKYQQRTICSESLFGVYANTWGTKWIERMLAFPIQADRIEFVFSNSPSVDLPNPIPWLLSRVDLAHERVGDVTASIAHYTAVTHGDLHCRNIFVDKHGEPWIIDYERTGEGPILRDFIELEIDFLLQYLDYHTVDDLSLYRLFMSVLKPNQLNSMIRSASHPKDLVKLCNIIDNLRFLAYSVAQVRDAREYYWGLLFDIVLTLTHVVGGARLPKENPLLRAGMLDSQTADVSRIRDVNAPLWGLLLLGGMICYRLDFWEKLWPPKVWLAEKPE